MSESSMFSFELSEWDKYQEKIIGIREDVYVRELALAIEQLVEDSDPESYHIIAYTADGMAIGTGCIHPNGRIGDIVVLKPWRDKTVGKAILLYLLEVAKTLGVEQIWIETTQKIVEFYKTKKVEQKDDSAVSLKTGSKLLH